MRLIGAVRSEVGKYGARASVLSLLAIAVAIVAANQWGAYARIGAQRAQLAEVREAITRAAEAGTVTPEQVQDELQLVAQQEALLDHEARMLAYPRSIQVALQSLATVGSLPVGLAAGLAFGSEFAWGTYRTLIALGRKRHTLLISQYLAFCVVVLAAIPASAVVAISIGAVLPGGVGVAGGWAGIGIASAGAVCALLLWSALGLLGAVLTGSPGGGVTVVAMSCVAGYFLSFLGPGVRAWSPVNLVVELVVFGASKILTSPFLMVAGVDARGMGTVRALLALTGATILAVIIASARFIRQEIR